MTGGGAVVAWFVVVAGLVALGFALDRVALWAEAKGWIYWRRRPRSATTAAGVVMGELLEVFQPTRHVVVEESDRKRMDIQHPESGAPGPDDVDLDRGRVTLRPDQH